MRTIISFAIPGYYFHDDAPIPFGSLVLTPEAIQGLGGADIGAMVSSFRAMTNKIDWVYGVRGVTYGVRYTAVGSYLLYVVDPADAYDDDDEGDDDDENDDDYGVAAAAGPPSM